MRPTTRDKRHRRTRPRRQSRALMIWRSIMLRKVLSNTALGAGVIVCSLALTVAVIESARANVIPGEMALAGWYLTHIQASSTIVVRRRGLPAFEMPCSWSTLPLFHGLGARPA